MKRAKNIIQACNWFQNVPIEGLDVLAKSGRVKNYDNRKYLYRLEDATDSIYAVLSGFVRIKISSTQGQEFSITEFSTNQWFGEYSLTDKPVRMFEAQVLEQSTILEIPKSIVKAVAEDYPVIYKNLFKDQSERTLNMCELLSGMLFYPLSARVAGRLLWFAQHFGYVVDGGVLINKKMNQQEIADLTMGSRQRVNEVIKRFERLGLLSVSSKQYLVKNLVGLKQQTQLSDEY